jgi:hypothetical protein
VLCKTLSILPWGLKGKRENDPMKPSYTRSFLTSIGSIFKNCFSHRNSGLFPSWNIGMVERLHGIGIVGIKTVRYKPNIPSPHYSNIPVRISPYSNNPSFQFSKRSRSWKPVFPKTQEASAFTTIGEIPQF